jgi:histidinol-phosphate aminotransferase
MLTRRSFYRRIALAAAAAPVWTEAAFAQRGLAGTNWPADTVWLNANENPEGPPRRAIEAIGRAASDAWQYRHPEFPPFYKKLAASEQLEPEQMLVGAGSTEVLDIAVAVFTSATRPLITAEPTFEAPGEMAKAMGRPIVRTALTETYASDVRRMAAEASKAGGGLIYLCNPNNPTSSMTGKEDIDWLVANLPANTVLVLDEAYLHFVPGYESLSGLPYVRQGKDVLVARTFSKIYGMAGVRCGFVCGRPELIARMKPYRNNMISILAVRAVMASLDDGPRMIAERRAKLLKIRGEFCDWLKANKLRYIEPNANFMMIDIGRDVKEFGQAMAKKGVAVGRPFPPYEKMLRVTIGTAQDMQKFRSAFLELYRA